MNFHLPQTQTARAEAATILAAPNHICTAQTNDTVCGLVQDAIWASFLMTRRGKYMDFVTLEQFCDTVLFIDGFDLSNFGKRVMYHYGGKDKPIFLKKGNEYVLNVNYVKQVQIPSFLLWSASFPSDFYYNDGQVVFKNGLLLKGEITKKYIGPHGVLLDKIAKYDGAWKAADWMTNIENVTNTWAASYGFSIGLDDFLTENDDEILATLAEAELKYEIVRDDDTKKELDREQDIMGILNSTISVGERLAKKGMNNGEDNALSICILSKAKGTYMNITQIAAALGQQNVCGGRIPKMLNAGRRSLPYFEEEDDSPAARGFVASNLLDGLSLPEAQFHAFGGREGLIDTACKTRETGYFQRCLVKTNEDLVVKENRMVMTYSKIVQFTYGDDNFDGTHLSKVKFPDGKMRLFFCDPMYMGKKMCTLVSEDAELLNQEQLNQLLKIIKHPLMDRNIDFVEQMLYNTRQKFSKLLREVKIPPRTYKKFYKICNDMYNRAVIDVGECVGICAAAAIGEMSTQKTLNTFHSSGTVHKAVTQGVPRLKEIKNATDKPRSRSIRIFLKEEYFPQKKEFNLEEACNFFEEYNKEILQIRIDTMLEELEVEIFEPNDNYACTDPLGFFSIPQVEEEWWVHEYRDNLEMMDDPMFEDKMHCGYRLRLKFSEQAVYDNCTDMFELCDVIYKKLSLIMSLVVIPSPCEESTIILYLSLKQEVDKISQVYGNHHTKPEYSVLDEKNAVYLCMRDIVIPIIKNIILKEETNVKRFFVEDVGEEGIPNHKRYCLDTEGGNLEKILSLDFVDTKNCITDDFWQVYRAFDIEAAKKCLIEEFYTALTGDGSYIDKRLISLTVDNLCRRGTIDSMRRDSVPMEITGSIQKMAFEKPIHYIVQSLISGVIDPCQSASGSIALGNNPQVGTEFVHLLNSDGTPLKN